MIQRITPTNRAKRNTSFRRKVAAVFVRKTKTMAKPFVSERDYYRKEEAQAKRVLANAAAEKRLFHSLITAEEILEDNHLANKANKRAQAIRNSVRKVGRAVGGKRK